MFSIIEIRCKASEIKEMKAPGLQPLIQVPDPKSLQRFIRDIATPPTRPIPIVTAYIMTYVGA